MSKNIIIQEGGTNYQFTAKKLKTDKVGGGSCLWVPEDEVSLGTKSVTANGTYKASDDGKYGFSQFTVNVAGGSGSADSSGKPISPDSDPDIGSSFVGIDPTDGEPYEYTVNPQGEVEKTPVPTATQSDTGSSFVGIDPTDGNPYEYTVNSQGEVDKTPVSTSTPGGPGSSVVGTDPEDGNEYFIGIDEGGNIVKTKIPSGIEIGKDPDKTTYTSEETIDYSGIIVILKGGDSAIFSNSNYPNGRIPYGELVFPVSAVSASGENATINGLNFTILGGSGKYETKKGDVIAVEYSGCDFCFIDGWGRLIFGGKNDTFNCTPSYNGSTNWGGLRGGSTTSVINNIKYRAAWIDNAWGGWPADGFDSIATNEIQYWDKLNAVLQTIYGSGNFTSAKEIPVQWTSPYDGRTFEAAFAITVTASGSGYSDDSGGSSSGGGTSF